MHLCVLCASAMKVPTSSSTTTTAAPLPSKVRQQQCTARSKCNEHKLPPEPFLLTRAAVGRFAIPHTERLARPHLTTKKKGKQTARNSSLLIVGLSYRVGCLTESPCVVVFLFVVCEKPFKRFWPLTGLPCI